MKPIRTVAVLIFALGCDRAAQPELSPGRLAYRASHQLPGGADTTLSGVLVLDHVSDDSIAGSWRVPGLAPELMGGLWNGEGYEALASARYFGIVEHRIRVDPATRDILCEGDYSWVDADGRERSTPVECFLSYGVPFELEPVETIPDNPIVRPSVPDTVR